MKQATDYIDELDMSRRPEFYSGRGPKTCDLNRSHLERFFGLIKEDRGDSAAEAFVAMVAGLKSGAATTFLLGLYALERQNWTWKYTPSGIETETDIGYSTHDEKEMLANAEATVFATLGRVFSGGGEASDAIADYAIRGPFLEARGWTLDDKKGWRKLEPGEKPRPRRSYMNSNGCFYDY